MIERNIKLYNYRYLYKVNSNLLNRFFLTRLLYQQPQLVEHCNINKITGWDWGNLLIFQPQYVEYCSWDKFEGFDMYMLLINKPEFVEYFDWDILVNKISIKYLEFLLEVYPRLKRYNEIQK